MKKVFGIVLALALVLTAAVASAVPAGAVGAPVNVCLDNPLALESSNYCITFHNGSLLKGVDGDYIDVMFPKYTDASSATVLWLQKSPAPPPAPDPWCAPCACTNSTKLPAPAEDVGFDTPQYEETSIRIYLSDGEIIEKCYFVMINIYGIVNPVSCEHHLQVGSSTHTPVASETYTIYCAKLDLVGGKNPDTGLDKMNLISLPCYPVDESIESVLADLFVRATATAGSAYPFSFSVWYWDNVAKTWLKYASDTSFDDLETIEPGKAYWVKPSQDATVYIHGFPYPAGQGPPVKWCYPFSWNMVGYASLVDDVASKYLAYTLIPPMYQQYCVLAIWDFDESTQLYAPTAWNGKVPPDAGKDPTLYHGEGYWMAFIAEGCIIPPA